MKQYFGRFSLLVFISYLMFESSRGFQKIAWGTGEWWGEYSIKWGAAYVIYVVFCILVILVAWDILFSRNLFRSVFERLIAIRERLGKVRWLLALFIFIGPVWLFQFTSWGVVFSDTYIRISVWFMTVIGIAFFIKKGNILFGWNEFIIAVLLTSSEFVIAVPFMNVTNYPFALGWSEGNRMWDYSIMFGRRLYDYPSDKEIVVLLDAGRQFVGGLPFILTGITIQVERFWIGLTVVLPYLLLGFAAFRFLRKKEIAPWILAGLWVLIFLKQGPIHPPLVLCAVVVALLWRRPLWLAIPIIAMTGYAAEESRFTWVFAPGLWIGMLELAGAHLLGNKLSRTSWVRAISLGFAGVAGGYFGQKIAGMLAGDVSATAAVSVNSVVSSVSSQPLLWYRLFPNATYGIGVLAGLLIATLPLLILLLYLVVSKKWILNLWQTLAVIVPLLAFLVVGIIVSTKIGGGGDLHNMDMFLIGLMFTALIAWEKSGNNWTAIVDHSPLWLKFIILLLFALPGFQSLTAMRSYSFAKDVSSLITLTDAPQGSSLDMYPLREITDSALDKIRAEVALARSNDGEVLFMDQRQLLTFGYITNVPLIPEYEKKILMNEALGSNANYFQPFYNDLAKHRFALIISEPLRTPVKDSSFQFGEENNAWVKWVSNPILCYYEEKITLKKVGVQLLVPKSGQVDCSAQLP
jgi:hypothetical protein